jgi:hypothetical protein
MDEKLEWIYYELWHHEGRRARHGASMSGPDYPWWHGIYEVAKSFYMEFLLETKRVAGEPLASELMEKYVYTQPGHPLPQGGHDQGTIAENRGISLGWHKFICN